MNLLFLHPVAMNYKDTVLIRRLVLKLGVLLLMISKNKIKKMYERGKFPKLELLTYLVALYKIIMLLKI